MGCGQSIPAGADTGTSVPVPGATPGDGEGIGVDGRLGRRQGTSATVLGHHQNAAKLGGDANPGGLLKGAEPSLSDPRARPEHFYHLFEKWPVIRPGLKEFLAKLLEAKTKGTVKRVFIYTANTSLHWVRFVMQCILKWHGFPLSLIDGIKHAPGGLKVVPENAVLYDDHPENAIGNCIQVDKYTNEIPWDMLAPLILSLPDHSPETCPCWEQCGGIKAFVDRDMAYKDRPHDPESDLTLYHLAEEFEPCEEVLLDMDETLLAGARISAYFNALNHFLMFRDEEFGTATGEKEGSVRAAQPAS